MVRQAFQPDLSGCMEIDGKTNVLPVPCAWAIACAVQNEDPAQSIYPKILAHVNARLARKKNE